MRTRCADCQKPLKPVVALDIDGTLGDYHGHFIQFAEAYLGYELPQHDGYDGSQRFWEYLGLELPLYRDVKLAYRQGGMKRTMPVHHGAAALTSALRSAGAEVWICTTRPWLRLDNVDPDTREWLRRNNLEYDYMVYGDDKFTQLNELVHPERVVGVLEDLPEQFLEAKGLDLSPILKANYHNLFFREHNILWDNEVDWNLWDVNVDLTERVLAWHEQHTQEHT